MQELWLDIARRLRAIASTGQHFAASEYDRERYDEIHDIALQMLSQLGDVPVETIVSLIPESGTGYETPRVDVRGAVFRDDKILLVREKLDGLWTLPGGYADVGLSPAENTEKEVLEEANLNVKATKLIAVVHKAKHAYKPDVSDFYKFYFLCEQQPTNAGEPTIFSEPKAGMETMDATFFNLDELPPLSEGRTIEKHIRMAYLHAKDSSLPTEFD